MTDMDKEMQKALEADGKKLRQLTGEDHGPEFWHICGNCGGEGSLEIPYPQHDDPYFCVVEQCRECGGVGMLRR